MTWIALKMLTGNRGKYYGIIFGISFATMLMTQQLSIFIGLMYNTASVIRDIQGARIWVMDPSVQFSEDITPLAENDLYRVRSVPGVAWATHLFKGMARAQLSRGNYKQFSLVGIDEQTFVGGPAKMVLGALSDLRQADAIILDRRGFNFLFPGQEPRIGWTVEMNDKRAVVVGICESSPTFQTFPIAYTLYGRALYFAPQERRVMSFILAQGEAGIPEDEICRRITDRTRLLAMTREGFSWRTISYYMSRTGIPINFGITVFLGFVIGAAIAGQTFYLFTLDNLKQYGALKAMGLSNLRIVGMVAVQAVVVGVLGYAIGVGLASGLEEIVAVLVGRRGVPPASLMVWQIPFATAAASAVIVAAASLFSLRKVLTLEPASVFR